MDGVWAPFWLLTAALMVALAIGRLGDVGGVLADIGRDQAASRGWYASRRPYQAAVVIGVVTLWVVSVTVAIFRTPERRRRYLPMSLAAITIMAFAAVRVISLHQLDGLLQHRDLGGVKVGAVIELALLAIASGVSTWVPRERRSSAHADIAKSENPRGTHQSPAARYDASPYAAGE